MPYDELIPDRYAAGKIRQAIVIMKLMGILSLVSTFVGGILAEAKGLDVSYRMVLVSMSPLAYVYLAGVPSMKMIKEDPKKVMGRVFGAFNVVPISFFVISLTDLEWLAVMLGPLDNPDLIGFLLLVFSFSLSSLYYKLVENIADNEVIFSTMMLVPTICVSLFYPYFIVYTVSIIPGLLLKRAIKRLERTTEDFLITYDKQESF